MRSGRLLRWLAALAVATAVVLGALADVSWRRALAARIDRAAQIEQRAALPAAAARLAAALLEQRLSRVSESDSQAVAAAFAHAEGTRAVGDYQAAGGDPAIAAEAQRVFAGGKPPTPDAEIALMRAVRGLRSQAAALPHLSPPQPPSSAAQGGRYLLTSAAFAAVALVLAYGAGRFGARRRGEPGKR